MKTSVLCFTCQFVLYFILFDIATCAPARTKRDVNGEASDESAIPQDMGVLLRSEAAKVSKETEDAGKKVCQDLLDICSQFESYCDGSDPTLMHCCKKTCGACPPDSTENSGFNDTSETKFVTGEEHEFGSGGNTQLEENSSSFDHFGGASGEHSENSEHGNSNTENGQNSGNYESNSWGDAANGGSSWNKTWQTGGGGGHSWQKSWHSQGGNQGGHYSGYNHGGSFGGQNFDRNEQNELISQETHSEEEGHGYANHHEFENAWGYGHNGENESEGGDMKENGGQDSDSNVVTQTHHEAGEFGGHEGWQHWNSENGQYEQHGFESVESSTKSEYLGYGESRDTEFGNTENQGEGYGLSGEDSWKNWQTGQNGENYDSYDHERNHQEGASHEVVGETENHYENQDEGWNQTHTENQESGSEYGSHTGNFELGSGGQNYLESHEYGSKYGAGDQSYEGGSEYGSHNESGSHNEYGSEYGGNHENWSGMNNSGTERESYESGSNFHGGHHKVEDSLYGSSEGVGVYNGGGELSGYGNEAHDYTGDINEAGSGCDCIPSGYKLVKTEEWEEWQQWKMSHSESNHYNGQWGYGAGSEFGDHQYGGDQEGWGSQETATLATIEDTLTTTEDSFGVYQGGGEMGDNYAMGANDYTGNLEQNSEENHEKHFEGTNLDQSTSESNWEKHHQEGGEFGHSKYGDENQDNHDAAWYETHHGGNFGHEGYEYGSGAASELGTGVMGGEGGQNGGTSSYEFPFVPTTQEPPPNCTCKEALEKVWSAKNGTHTLDGKAIEQQLEEQQTDDNGLPGNGDSNDEIPNSDNPYPTWFPQNQDENSADGHQGSQNDLEGFGDLNPDTDDPSHILDHTEIPDEDSGFPDDPNSDKSFLDKLGLASQEDREYPDIQESPESQEKEKHGVSQETDISHQIPSGDNGELTDQESGMGTGNSEATQDDDISTQNDENESSFQENDRNFPGLDQDNQETEDDENDHGNKLESSASQHENGSPFSESPADVEHRGQTGHQKSDMMAPAEQVRDPRREPGHLPGRDIAQRSAYPKTFPKE
ncbi:hypothetical protein Ddc_11247 [Ditylenchus destructor]|nr:hypothetical protein Ddc_11247 [Ditylenchus destructor]